MSPEIIAHGTDTLDEARRAVQREIGIEIDLSERLFLLFPKANVQHHGFLGKIGVGKNPKPFLKLETNGHRFFVDIKHPRPSPGYKERLSNLLENRPVCICGVDWELISQICKNHNRLPFYTLRETNHIERIRRILPTLEPPAGFSVEHNLITPDFMEEFGGKALIFAWAINDPQRAREMAQLGVDGIFSDDYEAIIAALNPEK